MVLNVGFDSKSARHIPMKRSDERYPGPGLSRFEENGG
jgi:hypothetical protein